MSFHARIIDELRNLVLEEERDTLNILSRGAAISDFAAYKEYVGKLFAYRRVLDMFDEAVKIVEKLE